MISVFYLVAFALCFARAQSKPESTYESRRAKIITDELEMSTGGKLILNEKENRLNNMLMKWKHVEIDEWFKNPEYYNFSKNYFEYKDSIKSSPVYRFIKSMPKGALLHVHANAVLGPDFFLNVTYKDNLYVCFQTKLMFKFALNIPEEPCESQWLLMKDFRRSMKDVTSFDMKLKKMFTLEGWNDTNAEQVWERFSNIFSVIYPLWSYAPVWEDYVYEMLKEFVDDGIFYVELRSSIPQMYDLYGTQYDELYFVNLTVRVVEKFKRDYPDFIGARMICSYNRHTTPIRVDELLSLTKSMKNSYPDFIIGFDLVSREDKSPLIEFYQVLEAGKGDLDYFFHAGETNWYGTETDENLVDAVVLQAKRIGHGYALLKHPGVLEMVRQEGICVEACVVSNSVLGLLKDMRAHPLAAWIAQGLPVILAGDDPGFWDADPLSTDFYVTFQGIASRSHDLRLLKQLALNSIQFSSMTSVEKSTAFELFERKWNEFVDRYLFWMTTQPDCPLTTK